MVWFVFLIFGAKHWIAGQPSSVAKTLSVCAVRVYPYRKSFWGSNTTLLFCFSKSVGVSNRQNKKVEEEEKLLKLFQGVNKAQDGFTQWCEQMLHALNTANNLDGKNWGGKPLVWNGRAGAAKSWQIGMTGRHSGGEI